MDIFFKKPLKDEVFNLGGGRENSASLIEIIDTSQSLTNKKLSIMYQKEARIDNHKWWITKFTKFKKFYPSWKIYQSLDNIILKIYKRYHDNSKV